MPRYRRRWTPTIVRNADGHDPWWDLDGGAARAIRGRARAKARLALVLALAADLAVLGAWAAQVGLTRALGLHG
ncbi:MAG TPA: hypothetical protein VFW20_02440 [Candidatus Limnocylindrales bacterium]|nr:hypothetical protein [Candidatus Limnocylindrales bacterium]